MATPLNAAPSHDLLAAKLTPADDRILLNPMLFTLRFGWRR